MQYFTADELADLILCYRRWGELEHTDCPEKEEVSEKFKKIWKQSLERERDAISNREGR